MNICLFCGSSTGQHPLFASHAREVGVLIAENEHSLVYGGGNIGLMGIVADAVMENNGKVIGIIPSFLAEREVAHQGITQLEIVGTMHQRKMRMAELSDAFLVLPGGWGTLDETAEILTWKQLGLIKQPVILLNTHRFFDPLLKQMKDMAAEGFLRSENLNSFQVVNSPQEIFALIP